MILIILKNFLKGVSKIKKLCCILCTLLFLFLFAFSKPNIKANEIFVGESVSDGIYALGYFVPSTISYNFVESYVYTVPNDYRYDYMYNTSDASKTYMSSYRYYSDIGENQFLTEINNTIVQRDYVLNEYWENSPYGEDIDDDLYFQISTDFEAGDNIADNLIIGYGFDNISCSASFLKSVYSQALSLYKVQLPFVNQEYIIEYTIDVTSPYQPFNYTSSSGNATGYLYDSTNVFTGTISRTFGNSIYTDLSPYVLSSEFGSFINNLPNEDERIILLNATYKIYIDDWSYMLVGEPIYYQRVLTHNYVDIIDFNMSSMGPHLPLELTNSYYLPRGLPTGDSSAFVPNLANSLLIGLQNFLSFELIPGFSLYHILMLIVAIPLLIFILKLFLGG